MMIGKNIRYYRLLREMSQEALANSIGIGKMAISNYESGKRTPDYTTSRKISKALDISLAKLLAQSNEALVIKHGAFRKHSTVTKAQQEVILGKADRYLGRLFEVVSFLGDPALPSMPSFEPIKVSDVEKAGQHLRSILGLPETGPIGNITDILENKGYIICPVDYDKRIFSGNSGTVNGRPYIAINSTMPAERQRFTLIHELAHLVFVFDSQQNEERMVDAIAGAFLLPKADIVRELGPKRTDIRGDLRNIQREYGVSMAAIVMRARQANIITKDTYETTLKWMSKNGLRTDEHSDIIPEKTHLLEQLISRAVAEDEIGISKAAELLELPLTDARRLCYGGV